MSVNQVVASALAEKLASLSPNYLEQLASRGNRDRFLEVLREVPSVEPDSSDRLD